MSTKPAYATDESGEIDLRISSKLVLVALAGAGPTLYLLGEVLSFPEDVLEQLIAVTFVCYGVSATAWVLSRWRPVLGRWCIVAGVLAVLYLASRWLAPTRLLALFPVPVLLAAALVDWVAAGTTAAVETALVLVLIPADETAGGALVIVATVMAIWATFGLTYAIYDPVHQLGAWLAEYLERAQHLLEEARDRRAVLEQVTDSLAHANRQLGLANQRMMELRTIAEEAQKAKTAFVARVSHEFRTPLNMIIGLAELMVETPQIYDTSPSPKMREDLRVIYRNSEHLSNMVNDVLDLTRVEAGLLALHREWVDLRAIVQDSAMTIVPLLEKKGLALDIVVPADLPQAYCDRTRIQQVILNLMSNAVRFTETGGITVRLLAEDQRLVVSVADTGPGINADDLERIFEPFCQGTDQARRESGGSGLGLSISRQFVNLHGGQIWVESAPGIGTTFHFTLPISLPLEHIVRPGHQIREDWMWRENAFRASQATRAGHQDRPRVVVCDDSGGLCAELARHTSEVEFIDTRGLGEALAVLEDCPAHTVLVNGGPTNEPWNTIEALTDRVHNTPIVGCAVPRPIERAIAAGALGHLVKPVTRTALQEALRSLNRPIQCVLLADDDPDALHLFVRMLRACDASLEIVMASNGRQALDALRETTPDVMLLDIVMPDMDGWEVLDHIRHEPDLVSVPTFLLSAQDPRDQATRSRFLVATMDGGLPLGKLLDCTLQLSSLLLKPETRADPVPG